MFFDVLGDLNQPIADIPASPPPVVPVDEPSPGTGIRDFAEIRDTMSVLSGVPSTNAAVRSTYNELIQQLPGDNDVRAFVSAQQVGISRLALDGTDMGAVHEGYAAVTPLHLDLTHHRALAQMADWEPGLNAALSARRSGPRTPSKSPRPPKSRRR